MNKELGNMKDKEAQDEWDINRNSTIGNEEDKRRADEMFRKLGYEKDIDVSYGLIRYNKNDKYFIRFVIEDKCVETNSIVDNEIYILSIDIKLLQAINTKVKELGWNE